MSQSSLAHQAPPGPGPTLYRLRPTLLQEASKGRATLRPLEKCLPLAFQVLASSGLIALITALSQSSEADRSLLAAAAVILFTSCLATGKALPSRTTQSNHK